MHIYIYMYMYVYISICICIYIYAFFTMCIYSHMRISTYIYIYTCIYGRQIGSMVELHTLSASYRLAALCRATSLEASSRPGGQILRRARRACNFARCPVAYQNPLSSSLWAVVLLLSVLLLCLLLVPV